jgi:hypothetical protein
VGEVAGWVYDPDGTCLDVGTNRRIGGVRVVPGLDRPLIGIAPGASKVPTIRAALRNTLVLVLRVIAIGRAIVGEPSAFLFDELLLNPCRILTRPCASACSRKSANCTSR